MVSVKERQAPKAGNKYKNTTSTRPFRAPYRKKRKSKTLIRKKEKPINYHKKFMREILIMDKRKFCLKQTRKTSILSITIIEHTLPRIIGYII